MKTQITFAAPLPALASFTPLHIHASSTSEDEMIVMGNTAAGTIDLAVSTGPKTNDMDVGPPGTRSWIETSYSSTTVTKEMIGNQQAQGVSEMLKYPPSTRMQARDGMDVGRPQSRGTQSSVVANSRLDGLNIVSTTALPVEMLECMDALNSLTGTLYDPASPAGQFNFVAKCPTEETLRKATLGYQNRSALTGHADPGGHFDKNRRFDYRMNLLDQEGEGNVNDSMLRRKLASVTLDWDIQPGTQLQLGASHYEPIQKDYVGSSNYRPDVKLPSAPNPKDKNLALSIAGNDLITDTTSTRLIHYFNDDRSMNADVGWQQADRAMRSVPSRILNNQGDISHSMKDPTVAGRFRVLSNTVGLNGHIDTDSIGHDLSFPITGYVQSPYSAKGTGPSHSWGTVNIYHLDAADKQGDGKIRTDGSRYRSSVNTQQGVTLGNMVTFTPQRSAMSYLDQSWSQTKNYDKRGNQTNQVDENGLSPNAALVYKITLNTVAYVNYADSSEQGGTVPTDESVKNAGQTLNPYRSKQYEVGLKSNIGKMNLDAALSRLECLFACLDMDNMYREQGNQVNNGLELTAAENVWQGLNIYSGVTFLNPRLKDTANALTSNKQAVDVPKVQANLLAEYSLSSIPEWVYSANVHYTGKRAVNDTNTSYAGSHTIWDLGMRYTTKVSNVPTAFRVVVNNVFDKHYWASILPSGTDGDNDSPSALIGGGREVHASVTFDF